MSEKTNNPEQLKSLANDLRDHWSVFMGARSSEADQSVQNASSKVFSIYNAYISKYRKSVERSLPFEVSIVRDVESGNRVDFTDDSGDLKVRILPMPKGTVSNGNVQMLFPQTDLQVSFGDGQSWSSPIRVSEERGSYAIEMNVGSGGQYGQYSLLASQRGLLGLDELMVVGSLMIVADAQIPENPTA